MYDANDRMAALQESMHLIDRIKDEIAGMGFRGLEYSLCDLLKEFADEASDLEEACEQEYREQIREQEREYYAAVY